MNDVTAAMALEQYKKLPDFMEKRKRVHDFYTKELGDIDWITLPPELPEYSKSSYYFYHIQITNGKRDELARYLRERGVYTTYRYFPIHRVKGYHSQGEFPNADHATDVTLCLPIHQMLTEDDLDFIVANIRKFGDTI